MAPVNPPPDFRETMSDAIRYWEPRRLIYNAVLLLVVVARFVAEWPRSKAGLDAESMFGLFILAVLANIAYCSAYFPDLAVQNSTYREGWLRWRWLLLVFGILLGAVLAYFFSGGFFPSDRQDYAP